MLDLEDSGNIGHSSSLRQNIIITVLAIIQGAWGYVCQRTDINAKSDEPTIAGALYHEMWAEKKRLRIDGPPQIVNEPASRSSKESLKPDGFIDFKLFYGWGTEQDYFGIECKRVSNRTTDNASKLAIEYITKGIMRFVEGKYSPNHDFAAMIGFVIDCNTQGCIDRICKQLGERTDEIKLEENWIKEKNFGEHSHLYRTCHRQYNHNSSITLLHLFLEINSSI